MPRRVVEETVRTGRLGSKRRMRVDLHGVSTFGPGSHHEVIRWEWITEITSSPHGVTVDSPRGQIVFPSGVFGLTPEDLAARLEQARSIFERGDVIEQLGGSDT
jgi:hypothetical protein